MCEFVCACVRVLFFLSGPQNGTEEVQNGGVAESKELGGGGLFRPPVAGGNTRSGRGNDITRADVLRRLFFLGWYIFFCLVTFFLGKEYVKLSDVRVDFLIYQAFDWSTKD